MKIYIKNMVCRRCIIAVQIIFTDLGILFHSIELGEVVLDESLSEAKTMALDESLEKLGFERIDGRHVRIIEKIKNYIITIVHHEELLPLVNLSELLKKEMHYDYSYLSHLFSATEGITIEKYFIAQKIEKVKELLLYDELTLSEIAWQSGYSSVSHLSSQFKKQTGLTPTFFKSMKASKRQGIEDL